MRTKQKSILKNVSRAHPDTFNELKQMHTCFVLNVYLFVCFVLFYFIHHFGCGKGILVVIEIRKHKNQFSYCKNVMLGHSNVRMRDK